VASWIQKPLIYALTNSVQKFPNCDRV